MATTFLKLAVRGELSAFITAHNKSLAKALTSTVRATANTIRSRTQRQIRKNFKSADGGPSLRLAKTLIQKNTPCSGYGFNPMSRITSRALYNAKGVRSAEIDLLDLFQTSATVRAAGRQWLAIPTRDAPRRSGRGGSRQATPAESKLELVFLRTKDPNKAVLVAKPQGSSRPVVMYVLLKQTTRTARIDLESEIDRAAGRLSEFYDRQWAREDAALNDQFGRGLSSSGPVLIGG